MLPASFDKVKDMIASGKAEVVLKVDEPNNEEILLLESINAQLMLIANKPDVSIDNTELINALSGLSIKMPEPPKPVNWYFEIKRDSMKLITEVIARPVEKF